MFDHGPNIVTVSGSKKEMSKAYGMALAKDLKEVYAILINYYSIPPEKSASSSVIIGRNYDFIPPFDRCSQYLTITIIWRQIDLARSFDNDYEVACSGEESCIN